MPGSAFAQAKPKPAADPQEAKAAAVIAVQKAYQTGAKFFQAGKYKEAVPPLSQALAGGGLPPEQMAKAMYYRGVANRKLGKPAQAMSDLTTAIWVSGGLNDADRAAAVENRQAAYREAGLGDQAPADVPTAAPVAAPVKTAAPAATITAGPPPAAATAPAISATPPAVGAPAPVVIAAAPPAALAPTAAPAAPAPVSSGIPSPFADNFGPPPRVAPPPAAVPAPQPAPVAAAPEGPNMLQKAGNSVSSFFGNLFGGGTPTQATGQGLASEPPLSTSPQQQTSSSGVMTAANPDGIASPEAEWSGQTQVTPAKTAWVPPPEPPISTGAVSKAQAAPAPPPPAKLTGKYILQVGAVRLRADADALAEKLKKEHGSSLGGRVLAIDEAVIGNFGSFHRVRVGPYADTKEPGKFCSVLLNSGYDCLVVTQ